MTKHHPAKAVTEHHDYLPAAGRDSFLPFYDLFTAALGVSKMHRTLIDQAGFAAGRRVFEIGCAAPWHGRATPGTVAHAVVDEGDSMLTIAESIGRELKLPIMALPAESGGFVGHAFARDQPSSSAVTGRSAGRSPSSRPMPDTAA